MTDLVQILNLRPIWQASDWLSPRARESARSYPFGGLSVLIEFFGRIGLVEQLEQWQPYCAKSPNHYHPGQILVGFMLSVIAGAQRFAHANQLRADRALHALLGMKRFPSDDTILNYFRRFSQAEIERFWRPLWRWLISRLPWLASGYSLDLDSTIFSQAPSNKELLGATIRVDRAD